MNNLRIRRKEMGYTCESLGKLVNVQKSAISKYERGEIQPSREVLLKLAQILDCTTDFLLGRVNIPGSVSIAYRDTKTTHDYIFNTDDPTPPNKKAPPKPEPDIKWGDFGISFYDGGKKKLTQAQKEKITKLVQIAVMDDDYWDNENGK